MEWRCAECGDPESGENVVLMACHHCGRLLCQDDRTALSSDVFDGDEDEPVALAYHCADCYGIHHQVPEFDLPTGQSA